MSENNNIKGPVYKKQRHSTALIMVLLVLAIIPVAIYEFIKNSVQGYFNQRKKVTTESFSGFGL